MSYEIVKSIVLKDKDKSVWLNSADSSVRPLHFSTWECKGLSDIYQKAGREAVLALIGKDVWDGNLHLYQGNKLCNLFLTAREALPRDLSFMNFDGKTAGEFLGQAVAKLEKNSRADLSEDVNALLSLRNDKDYILEVAKRTGHNFLNNAEPAVQQDREFALEVMKACGDSPWADYPKAFENDKAFALEVLKSNGCRYRHLSPELKADKDVIVAAFAEAEGKKYHEHLPDLIPPETLWKIVDGTSIVLDRQFVCDLLDICPSMHLSRLPLLVDDGEICLKWCQVGKFFPYDVQYVPEEYLQMQVFQDALVDRFAGTELYGKLVEKLAEKHVYLEGVSLDATLNDARAKAVEYKNKGLEKELDV